MEILHTIYIRLGFSTLYFAALFPQVLNDFRKSIRTHTLIAKRNKDSKRFSVETLCNSQVVRNPRRAGQSEVSAIALGSTVSNK